MFQLGDQVAQGLSQRLGRAATAMFEDAVPMGDRVLVDPSSAPAPGACDCRDEVGADAAFDLHVLRIPSGLRAKLDTLAFFGGFAFGLRTSLFERICPLAIVVTPADPLLLQVRRASLKTCLDAFEKAGTGCPGFRASFEAGAHVTNGDRRGLLAI